MLADETHEERGRSASARIRAAAGYARAVCDALSVATRLTEAEDCPAPAAAQRAVAPTVERLSTELAELACLTAGGTGSRDDELVARLVA